MADKSSIEWTDATWQIVTGCSVLSPGCTNCYAMKLAGTRLRNHPSREGLTVPSKGGPVWNGRVRFNEQWLDQPLRWKRPRRIFVCAHGDLFHEGVTDEWLDKVFAVMALTPWHTYQVLTKRAERMRDHVNGDWQKRVLPWLDRLKPSSLWNGNVVQARSALNQGILPNVQLGVSAEDQPRADERIPHLLATPAAVRFVSLEPLLGPIDLKRRKERGNELFVEHYLTGAWASYPRPHGEPVMGLDKSRRLHWVIAGGESGPGARSCSPIWARALRDQCAAASVSFFWKQWGQFAPRQPDEAMISVGKKAAGSLLDGVEHKAMPR